MIGGSEAHPRGMDDLGRDAAINVLHESFTHEAYRRSPDIPRVRDGKKTFFTACEGPLLAFGFRM